MKPVLQSQLKIYQLSNYLIRSFENKTGVTLLTVVFNNRTEGEVSLMGRDVLFLGKGFSESVNGIIVIIKDLQIFVPA